MALTKVRQGITALPFSNRNKIINGNFDIWQRGTSQTANGYGSADRWMCYSVGTTQAVSRQPFAMGQAEVPGNPTYYMRTVVTSVAGPGNLASIQHHIEGVRTLAGMKATLSFWAKANASKPMAVSFKQSFGNGGTPSSPVNPIGPEKITLNTTWQKYIITVDLPSIADKTLGTDGMDLLQISFWFDAGSNFNDQSASLGQQSGTFDIAQVQLEEGEIATPFEQRHIADELALCQRYHQRIGGASNNFGIQAGYSLAGIGTSVPIIFPVTMRSTPTIVLPVMSLQNCSSVIVNSPHKSGFLLIAVASAAGAISAINTADTMGGYADAEL